MRWTSLIDPLTKKPLRMMSPSPVKSSLLTTTIPMVMASRISRTVSICALTTHEIISLLMTSSSQWSLRLRKA